MSNTYYHVVCKIAQQVAYQVDRLAITCRGTPTATQYLSEFQLQDRGEELYIFTLYEDANTFIRAAYNKFGESFDLLHFNRMPDGYAGYYFRDRLAIIMYRVVCSQEDSVLDMSHQCGGAKVPSSSSSLSLDFEDEKKMSNFLRIAFKTLPSFALFKVQGICGD